MAKIALYRKYRPSNFKQIYGQSNIVLTLLNVIHSGDISHAYIFSGPKGSGKTSIAKIFSRAINCESTNMDDVPCNGCNSCLSVLNNNTTDIVELDAASNSGVSEIRNLIEATVYSPTQLKYKVYIIDEAHMLTISSWNALLKTLEEPPAHMVFIFATTEYHKIPATIVSRCQRFNFNKIPNNELLKLIQAIAKKEQIKITDDAINLIISLADGAARDAISILEQIASYTANDITTSKIEDLFGLLSFENKAEILKCLWDNKLDNLLKLLDKYESTGVNFYMLAQNLLEILIDKIIYMQTDNANLLQHTSLDQINSLNCSDLNNIIRIADIINTHSKNIKDNTNPSFQFKWILLKIIGVLSTDLAMSSEPILKSAVNQPINKFQNIFSQKTTNLEVNSKPQQARSTNITSNLFKTANQQKPDLPPSLNQKLTSDIDKDLFKTSKSKLSQKQELHKVMDTTALQLEENIKKPENLNLDFLNLNSNYDIENDRLNFYKIAANHKKDDKKQLNAILEKIKTNIELTPIKYRTFLNTKSILISSVNGLVLLFDDNLDVEIINELKKDLKFYDWIKEVFTKKYFLLPITKKNAKILSDDFKLDTKATYKDVEIINNNDKINVLLDILNN